MEKLDITFQFPLEEAAEVQSLVVADQKDYFETGNDLVVRGTIFFDLNIASDEEVKTVHEERELDLKLSKEKYHLKDLEVRLRDYDFRAEKETLTVVLHYDVTGEDVCLERFCSLEDASLEHQLRDYLHRDGSQISQLQLDEGKIILLDPVVSEEPIAVCEQEEPAPETVAAPVETEPEDAPRFAVEDPIPPVREAEPEARVQEPVRETLFTETYVCSFIYYRVREGDSIESISARFRLSPEELRCANPGREIRKDVLLQIPHHV